MRKRGGREGEGRTEGEGERVKESEREREREREIDVFDKITVITTFQETHNITIQYYPSR